MDDQDGEELTADIELIKTLMRIRPKNPGYSLPCPNCDGHNTIYTVTVGWLCLDCGVNFDSEDTIPYYDPKDLKDES